jgi:hypothetical protein
MGCLLLEFISLACLFSLFPSQIKSSLGPFATSFIHYAIRCRNRGIAGPYGASEPGYSLSRCSMYTLDWRWLGLKCTCLSSRYGRWRKKCRTMYQMRKTAMRKYFPVLTWKSCEGHIQRGYFQLRIRGGHDV